MNNLGIGEVEQTPLELCESQGTKKWYLGWVFGTILGVGIASFLASLGPKDD